MTQESKQSLWQTIARIWPLIFGLALLGICIGGQGSLLGVRATLEGFDTRVTGILMSGYFVGFLFGSLLGPSAVQRVGHVRTFGALTALASVTVLIHAIQVDPWVWTAMRFGTGLAVSGLYVVSESWLNQAATDETRGRILSIYMITFLGGISVGQFLLTIADPMSFEIFSLISVLLSIAAIPMLVTAVPTPPIETPTRMSIADLFRWAPAGVIGAFLVNAGFAMLLGMAPVYAAQSGLTVTEVAIFMAVLMLGGTLGQWPLGKLSDYVDRRLVMFAAAGGTCLLASVLARSEPAMTVRYLVLLGVMGALFMPLYALAIALTNDFLPRERIVAACGTLLLVAGIGASTGPTAVAFIMERFGTASFFWSLATLCAVLSGYAGWRLLTVSYVPDEERIAYSAHPPTSVGGVLHAEPEGDPTKHDHPDGPNRGAEWD